MSNRHRSQGLGFESSVSELTLLDLMWVGISRNKIGARRFRERRKEYITTLEGKLHERDEVIGAYRGRLETSLDEVAARESIESLAPWSEF